jgi:hypothetical protein
LPVSARELVQVADQAQRGTDQLPHAFDALVLFGRQLAVDAAREQIGIPVRGAERILDVMTESTHETRPAAHDALQLPPPLARLVQESHLFVGERDEMRERSRLLQIVVTKAELLPAQRVQRTDWLFFVDQRQHDARTRGENTSSWKVREPRLAKMGNEHRLARDRDGVRERSCTRRGRSHPWRPNADRRTDDDLRTRRSDGIERFDEGSAGAQHSHRAPRDLLGDVFVFKLASERLGSLSQRRFIFRSPFEHRREMTLALDQGRNSKQRRQRDEHQ